MVDKVTCEEKSVLPGKGKKVALLDLGAKRNIAQSLNKRGCEVTVYPAHTTAEEILSTNPDGIMLSNGPGDPKECKEIIAEIRKLYESDTPIFAICLGHQLMALATGADTCLLYTSLSLNDELIELRQRVKEQDKEIRRLKEENEFLEEASAFFAASHRTVSYTHLDVYKRQVRHCH